MEFPKDHYTHNDSIEWWYFWGKLLDGRLFHFATFRGGKGKLQNRATHWSLHNKESQYFEELSDAFNRLNYTGTYIARNNRFSIRTKHFGLVMFPNSSPIIHDFKRNYYSIPSLIAEGYIYPDTKTTSDVWMDHEFGRYRTLNNWDWVSGKLTCGLNFMATVSSLKKVSLLEVKGNTLKSDFIIENKHLFFHELSMYLTLEPIVEEKVFHPKFGLDYSEQPFEVISKGSVIGYGMRERTYQNKFGI